MLDIAVIGLENFKASKFARHLRRCTAGGASNDSRFAKGDILMSLKFRNKFKAHKVNIT